MRLNRLGRSSPISRLISAISPCVVTTSGIPNVSIGGCFCLANTSKTAEPAPPQAAAADSCVTYSKIFGDWCIDQATVDERFIAITPNQTFANYYCC